MEINYRTRKIYKVCTEKKASIREYGPRLAKVLWMRLAFLRASANLAAVPVSPPFRLHKLFVERKDSKYAIDLIQPFRLIFEPFHDPKPLQINGGLDLSNVTKITIVQIEDYHGKSRVLKRG